MKKIWHFFWIITILTAAAVCIGAAFAARLSEALCAACVLLGAAAWAIFFAHFRSIEYVVEKDRIIIRSGFLIRSERSISKPDILWRTTVKFGSVTLFSVLHTSSGKAAVFALPDQDVFAI